jgi:hypothetical protein
MGGETRRIEEQLRRAFEGEAWHGPSIGVTQHNLHHAGQIALLKRALGGA